MIGKPVHYIYSNNAGIRFFNWSACGRNVCSDLITKEKSKVECLRCRKTKLFRNKREK